MAGTKEIRLKIKSVQNTRKITKAMEMVAASKMRKAQQAAIDAQAFARMLYRIQRRAVAHAHEVRHHDSHRARDPIAVNEEVLHARVADPADVCRHAVQQLVGITAWDPVALEDVPQSLERRIRERRFAANGVELAAQSFDRRARGLRIGGQIDGVVAAAAPGIEQRRVVADARGHEARGPGERTRVAAQDSPRQRLPRRHRRHDAIASAASPRSAVTSRAVAFPELITPGTPAPGCVPAPTM